MCDVNKIYTARQQPKSCRGVAEGLITTSTPAISYVSYGIGIAYQIISKQIW